MSPTGFLCGGIWATISTSPFPITESLTRIRERYGLEIFRTFFDRIVEMCFEAGLVWGEELFVNSTTVRANAAKAALIPKLTVIDYLDELFEEESDDATVQPTGVVEMADATLPGADDEELAEANAARKDFISSAGRYGTKSRTPNPNKISDHVLNRTDPDACLPYSISYRPLILGPGNSPSHPNARRMRCHNPHSFQALHLL